MVWVCAHGFVVDHAAITLFAANGATNRHPEAGLPAVAHVGPVSARASSAVDRPQISLPVNGCATSAERCTVVSLVPPSVKFDHDICASRCSSSLSLITTFVRADAALV